MNGVSGLDVLLVFAGFAGVLVVGSVVGLILLLAHTERLVATAEQRLAGLPCPQCGVAIGAKAAADAKVARDESVRKMREMAGNAMLRLRIPPHWSMTCPACGAALKFDPGVARTPLVAG
jgi:predicted RNA-binding Zn-ribbon protein involved in translation (DUF1610 family)